MTGQADDERLNQQIIDTFSELFGQMLEQVEELAQRHSLPAFCVKALHMLSSPMTMKELGRKFQCDPSFVTAIADLLDSRGLGRRETDTRDRRVKHLLLTPQGLELRERLEQELFARMPWSQTLDLSERKCLLALLRKMAGGARPAGEVTAEPKPAADSGMPR